MSLLIKNLSVSIGKKDLLKDINLEIKPKELHVLMGPNGSGKTTLARTILGINAKRSRSNKNYKLKLNNKDITALSTDERARQGLFLAYQNPVAVAGVNTADLLRASYRQTHKSNFSVWDFNKMILGKAEKLEIPQNFLKRSLESDFSAGERKKLEMFQAVVLQPKYAIFDEIDTGLDSDALKIVAGEVLSLKKRGAGILLITHYRRILSLLMPDFVHILVGGRIVESGGEKLSKRAEKEGFGRWKK